MLNMSTEPEVVETTTEETKPTLSMAVLNPEDIKKELEAQSTPETEEQKRLREQAKNNALAIFSCDINSLQDKRNVIASIESFGTSNMNRSTEKNSLLKTSVGKLAEGSAEGSMISKGLLDLQTQVKSLDPSALDFTKKGLLGKMTSPIRNYFQRYQKAEAVIASVVEFLELGKKTLQQDNVTLQIEQEALKKTLISLKKEVEMGMYMDEELVRQIEEAKINGVEQEKIDFVEQEVLFPLRQHLQDMQTMTVVNQQGIIAMEVIRRNNLELIRGVNRATSVTVSALRTAVQVAAALYNQQIVLTKINALNQTTSDMIAATSKMLKEQGTQIQKQAVEATISPDTLKTAFQDVVGALEELSTFKQNALPVMKQQIDAFREIADQGEKEITKLEKGNTLGLIEGA